MSKETSKSQIVVCGDSIGCSFRMKIRVNSYGDLLSRRLGKTFVADYVTGANTTVLLQMVSANENTISYIKDSEIVIITVGGNNVLIAFLTAMIRALDLGPLGARTMSQIGQKLKTDKLAGLKIVNELLGKKTRQEAEDGVKTFKKELPLAIKKIKEINPDTIVIVQTICNPFETIRSLLYWGIGQPIEKYINILNSFILQQANELGYIVADTAKALKESSREDEVTNMKRKDIHLTDFGHSVVYNEIYNSLVNAYPKYKCEEHDKVYKTRKTLTEDEIAEQLDADAKTAAIMGEEGGEGIIIQPQDFSIGGAFDEYNDWFTAEAGGTKFYPLRTAKIKLENEDIKDKLKVRDTVIVKMENDEVFAFDADGVKIGKVTDEDDYKDAVSIEFAIENEFKMFAKLFKDGENPEMIFAIYPTYDYYRKSVRDAQKA